MTDTAAPPTAGKPNLLIIIASTRPGRVGLPVGEWVARQAEAHSGFTVTLADLAEINLPFLDEPAHPRLGQYTKPHTFAWSALVDAADAVIIVTPEYNHSYPAPIKNAIDFLHREWQHKPVAFVSYGGVAAGTRGVQHLKPVLSQLRMVPITEGVAIGGFHQYLNEDGIFAGSDALNDQLTGLLHALLTWNATLRPLRTTA